MILRSENTLAVYGFSKTCIMMVTIMKDYVTHDSGDHDADFRYSYRDNMIAQFKQNLINKNFSFQHQSKGNQ